MLGIFSFFIRLSLGCLLILYVYVFPPLYIIWTSGAFVGLCLIVTEKAVDLLPHPTQFLYFLDKSSKAHYYYTGDRGIWTSVPTSYYMDGRPSWMVNALPYHCDPSTKVDSSRHRASVGRTVDCPCDASQQPVGWLGHTGGCRRCDRQGYCDGLPSSMPSG